MRLPVTIVFLSLLNAPALLAEESRPTLPKKPTVELGAQIERQNVSESLMSQKDAAILLKNLEESIQRNPQQASETLIGDIYKARNKLERTYILQDATENALLDRIQQLTAIVKAQDEAIRNFKDLVAELQRENEALKNDQ